MLASWLQARWYQARRAPLLLRPLARLFEAIAGRRRVAESASAWHSPVPVVVIGNIAVGGTGKTPLAITLLSALQAAGFRPAVISRGYGGSESGPLVLAGHTPAQVGDEPVLIAERSGCPVAIGRIRVEVIQALLSAHPETNLILSDDGLQHYRMGREFECVVIDGARGLGNGSCLPAGPLREPPSRLAEVDHIVVNGPLSVDLPLAAMDVPKTQMNLVATTAINLCTGEVRQLASFAHQSVHAVAGIGDPGRFFETLSSYRISIVPHPFADHHPYSVADFDFSAIAGQATPMVLMTEKDAVKCQSFALPHWWMVPVEAQLEGALLKNLIERFA